MLKIPSQLNKEKAIKVTKWTFRKVVRGFFYFSAFILLYLFVGFILSRISTSKEHDKDQSIEIFVHSNGVHTDIVMPYKNAFQDWETYFPGNHTRGKSSDYSWVAVGWGDKGFYLETPTWGDLTVKTAVKAAFGLSSAALHATLHKEMKESTTTKSIRISKKQYRSLIRYVLASLQVNKNQKPILIPTKAVYGDSDAFYESKGVYSMFHTCNTWANNALKACRQKACWWTWNSSAILRLHEKRGR